jgi:hypothetical protein
MRVLTPAERSEFHSFGRGLPRAMVRAEEFHHAASRVPTNHQSSSYVTRSNRFPPCYITLSPSAKEGVHGYSFIDRDLLRAMVSKVRTVLRIYELYLLLM